MSRPIPLLRLCVGLYALFLAVLAPTASWANKMYAMVIGIDRYEHITPLQGAVNDAVDIASAISALEPESLELLLDGRATREKILSTWRRYLEIAEPGDTIIITFAGHGASEPALYPESEDDGRDESFLLAGFNLQGAAAGERLRDDEIAELIEARPDVQHILVADSCHSGTATRSTQFDLGYRFFTHDGIEADPLPPPPPPPASRASDQLPESGNSVFFAAVGDAELAPEIDIDGNVRGALSYAFARGLRGEADRDNDGLITKGELETHVRRHVKALLDGRQKPRVSPVGEINRTLFQTVAHPPPEDSAFAIPFAKLPTVPVAITGTAQDFTAAMLSGSREVSSAQDGGIVVDFTRRELRTGTGEQLRRLTEEIGFDWRMQTQAVIDKMRIVNALEQYGISSKIDVSFPFGDTLYFEDDALRVLVTGRSTKHVTIFNLSSEGRVQWLYPRYAPIDPTGGFNDPPEIDPNTALSFDAVVVPPFGFEHIVVIETNEPHEALRRAARRFDGSDALPQFWRELHLALKETPHSVGIHAYVTQAQ
ncbi:MAG: hypothetical protein V2I76_06795 [Roseobacter sp.]|jgi:hypothetical protein|nr:hypothetical protein [Roseobacter sp.]